MALARSQPPQQQRTLGKLTSTRTINGFRAATAVPNIFKLFAAVQ